MASRLGYSDIKTMFQQRLPHWWASKELGAPSNWKEASNQPWRVLQFVAQDLKLIDGYVFGLLQETITSTKVPEIKLKAINILTASMDHLDSNQCDPDVLRSLLQVND